MVKNVRFNFVKRSLPVGNVKKAKPTQKITGDINLEFEVISNKVFDRNKSYYSVFFQSVIIKLNHIKYYINMMLKLMNEVIIFVFIKIKLITLFH